MTTAELEEQKKWDEYFQQLEQNQRNKDKETVKKYTIDYIEQLTKQVKIINSIYSFSEKIVRSNAPKDWNLDDLFDIINYLHVLVHGCSLNQNIRIFKQLDSKVTKIVTSNLKLVCDEIVIPKINNKIQAIRDLISSANRLKIDNSLYYEYLRNLERLVSEENIKDVFHLIYFSKECIVYTDDEFIEFKNCILAIRNKLIDYKDSIELPTKKDWEI